MGWDLVWVRARMGLGSGMDVTDDTGCEEIESGYKIKKEYSF
jgi:hypothetical protein